MIPSIFISVLIQCTGNGDSGSGPDSTSWELVWNDEFDGSDLDLQKWNYETGGHGWGNNELQYYTDRLENSYTDSGFLFIEAKREYYQQREFTSARLTTRQKGDWKYGKIEVRARLPEGQGIWPAIWMMPTNSVYGGWPTSGEIDIMELVGHEPHKIHGTIHYGGPYPEHVYKGDEISLGEGRKFSDDFHVFSIEWEPGEIRWYLDGRMYFSEREWYSGNGVYPAPFDQEFYLILNVAVGGNWPGSPDASTQFPQDMTVDYIRVYKHNGERPTIEITSPSNNSLFNVGETVSFSVETGDSDGQVQIVEYLGNGKLLGVSEDAPFNYNWNALVRGEYRIIAKARDNDGRTELSRPVIIQIGD